MQIRLTVLVPRSGQAAARPCDVLVTAPAGTVLAAVTGALATTAAAAASAEEGTGTAAGGTGAGAGAEASASPDTVPVYAGAERLSLHHQVLGEPPLIDGAVVSLHGPVTPAAVSAYGPAKARLHMVAGPDAGGIHLLQGGNVRLGRSADADVPLDDPDVSRLHCAVTVTDGGAVTVTDLGSTNGTTVDGSAVGERPALLRPGATLRLGESVIRLESSPSALPPALPTGPDGEGRLRLAPAQEPGAVAGRGPTGRQGAEAPPVPGGAVPYASGTRPGSRHETPVHGTAPPGPHSGHGSPSGPHSHSPSHSPSAAEQPGRRPAGAPAGAAVPPAPPARTPDARRPGPGSPDEGRPVHDYAPSSPLPGSGGTHGAGLTRPPEAPEAIADTGRRRRRGIGAWARKLAVGREETDVEGAPPPAGPHEPPPGSAARAPGEERWPDPATVLLTALGPGPRLWERGRRHPDALTVRLGSAHRSGGPGAPVTVDLREAGALGLAGPRARLSALARSLLAQLTALHAPGDLEIVLLCADRARSAEARTAEWGWLGWLPHLRPSHGQDCRLLLAYDRDQAAARTTELTRRLDEAHGSGGEVQAGPRTVLVVDGDPGSASTRAAVARLVAEGASAGIHVLCLAETPPASPASPLDATVEAAQAATPAFLDCGTLALLSGAVATAVRVVRRDAAGSTVATLDGVSVAWAERFARALAPLREPAESAGAGSGPRKAAVPLPQSCRLLDELGLARATPAAVLSRWAESATDRSPLAAQNRPAAGASGRAPAVHAPAVHAPVVFGAGVRGTVAADLAADEGHHLCVTGPAGSGKTELMRSLAASLAAGERPGRLALVLVDGDGDAAARGGGLKLCADLPQVTGCLAAGDPVRMREFAQSLSAELKRRAELIGPSMTFDDYARAAAEPPARVVSPRRSPEAASAAGASPPDPEPATMRLRARGHSREETGIPAEAEEALPRLVVLVDDFDTLVDPALGNPGRPAAGSVVRALESVAREGSRLGMHVVTASGRPERTGRTTADRSAAIRVELTGPEGEESPPGRGAVRAADGTEAVFQAGRVTGRIPRTATLRPTVVPLDWARAGDPPTRRPVRELGNGPTDLALLASAMERAARSPDPGAESEPATSGRARARGTAT